MSLADVLIHLDETLAVTQRERLEGKLRKVEGVIAPRFNSDRPHLLMVAYDPRATNPGEFLRTVEISGYRAQLVGM